MEIKVSEGIGADHILRGDPCRYCKVMKLGDHQEWGADYQDAHFCSCGYSSIRTFTQSLTASPFDLEPLDLKRKSRNV